jgi:hypothetical protein
MSMMGDTPPPALPPQRKYILETGVMIFFGICFLFPGLCSLYFIAALTIEKRGNPLDDPYVRIIAPPLWVTCFIIAAIGIVMIVAARRRPRREP